MAAGTTPMDMAAGKGNASLCGGVLLVAPALRPRKVAATRLRQLVRRAASMSAQRTRAYPVVSSAAAMAQARA